MRKADSITLFAYITLTLDGYSQYTDQSFLKKFMRFKYIENGSK